ncbi:MAG: OPT family oligopeptide transporter [Planctomycetota bacterium]|nr:MAG: OPT family oligopeptide transporter [Planctomycetota bacterium]
MTIQQLTDDQIREWTPEQKDRWWLENVYRGDMPQLTLRAALTGFILGGLLSATNLYIGAKTGWSLGVGITSVILAFAFFKILQQIGFREFTILENNAMQSIATSAGYMTAPLTSSLAAYMIVNSVMLPWWQIIAWNVALSILGVLFAFPMKRRFINDEQHPFPEGQAAGVVMDTLHSSDASVGIFKAKVLAYAAAGAAYIKFLQSEGIHTWWQTKLHDYLFIKSASASNAVEFLKENAKSLKQHIVYFHEDLFALFGWTGEKEPQFRGIPMTQLTISPGLDIALMGAGGLMGIRSGVSLMVGAVLNYCVLVPLMIHLKEIVPKEGTTNEYGMKLITQWSLWPGVAGMVVASFVAFFAKPGTITSAFKGLTSKKTTDDPLKHIEFPLWISLVGIPIMSLITAVMAYSFFQVPIWASLVGLPLTFVLSLVAANSTAITSMTPTGATSKITQLFYGLIRPGDIKSNLATAGITAEIVSNSSNLLMDIKPGYMLGAKPRQQAIGHIIGIISGSLASTFLFFVLFTKGIDPQVPSTVANLQSEKFPMPSVTVWMGVAKILTEGFDKLPPSVVTAVIIASLAALVLEILRIASRNKFPLSPVAMGLAFVIDFKSSLCMFAGSLIFWLLGVGRIKEEEAPNHFWVQNFEPVCAGIIAGASLMGIADMLVAVFLL